MCINPCRCYVSECIHTRSEVRGCMMHVVIDEVFPWHTIIYPHAKHRFPDCFKIWLRVRYNVVTVRPEFRTSWILTCIGQYFTCELLSKNRLGEVNGGVIDTNGFFPPLPMPPRPFSGLRGPPSWAWQECNGLLRLGRPLGAVTLSRCCEWWYRMM